MKLSPTEVHRHFLQFLDDIEAFLSLNFTPSQNFVHTWFSMGLTSTGSMSEAEGTAPGWDEASPTRAEDMLTIKALITRV